MSAVLPACSDPEPGNDSVTSDQTELPTAATLGAQVVLPTADYLKMSPYEDADIEYGARLVMQCRACHTFEQGGAALNGPNLHGIFGRPVASTAGYPYSPALSAADFVWTPAVLDAWLARPAQFLPGNRMAWPGMSKESDRNALIAALLRLTNNTGEHAASDRVNEGREESAR